jgi:hypothetical protein
MPRDEPGWLTAGLKQPERRFASATMVRSFYEFGPRSGAATVCQF